MYGNHMHENERLDPRRRSRGMRRRDWASKSATISIGRVHELFTFIAVRLGLAH